MIIQSKKVWYQGHFVPLQIEISYRKIENIFDYNSHDVDIDFGSNRIMPGLIDIHCHGWNGKDVVHSDSEWFRDWRKHLISEGVTSFLPAASTTKYEDILNGLQVVANSVKNNEEGVNVLGIYSEGPFISTGFPGAQDVNNLVIPTEEVVDEFIEASDGLLRYVMVAPEMLDDNYDVIKYMVKKGLRVSIGHSGASYEQCEAAIKAGVTSFTHTFNGMPPFKNRTPGPAGAAMWHHELFAEMIGDGTHVDPITAKIFAGIKGKDRLITVTDSSRFKGLPVGEHILYGKKIIVCEDGVGRFENGKICGGCGRINKVLQTEIEVSRIDEETAINSMTINPCLMLGIQSKGKIQVNYDADISVFDENYEPIAVFINGKKVL